MGGLGIGRALTAGATSLGGYADDLLRERLAHAQEDRSLAAQGFFRKDALPAPSAGKVIAPLDDAAGASGDPMQPTRPQADPQELADALSAVASQSPPKEPTARIGGEAYGYRPEMTPQGRALALRQALEDRQDQAAYTAFRGAGGTEPYEAARGHWSEINRQRIGQASRTAVDPAESRRMWEALPEAVRRQAPYIEGHDYKPLYDSFIRGEIGKQDRIDFRVMFPPQGRSGNGTEKDENGLPRRSRDEQTQDAQAEVEVTVRNNYGKRANALSRDELTAIMRRHPGASMSQVGLHGRRVLQQLQAADPASPTHQQ